MFSCCGLLKAACYRTRQKLGALRERGRLAVELERSKEMLQALVDNFPGGISMMDEHLRLTLANEGMKRLLNFPDSLFKDGLPTFEDCVRFNAMRGEYGPGDPEEQVAARMELARKREPHMFDRVRPDGTALEIRGVPLDNGGFVTTYMDVTERYRSQAEVTRLALHDALTQLANRTLLNERLQQALTRVRRNNEIVAILFLDLDHFKKVNDTLGHPAGDNLLKMVSGRLRNLVRETDTIARMGGDEFAILQVAIAQPSDATSLAQRVIEAIVEPFVVGGHQVVIGTSVGIAVGPTNGVTAEQLMQNADLALYRAKGEGRGMFRLFEDQMDAEMRERCATESELRRALSEGQFELHYQPLVNLARDQICGFEALVHWRHREKGLLPPDRFIPLAEELGLILPLGEWIIRDACSTAASWPENIKLAVNVSPKQLRSPAFAQVVAHALAAAQLPPQRLEVEITETALLTDSKEIAGTLNSLRTLGVKIAVDDFGTGFSSLGHLRRFRFDKIKIHRTFVEGLVDDSDDFNIVRAVALLAKGLGVETTAKGVETQAQLEGVTAEGCTEMQGSLFSKPLPADQIEQRYLAKLRKRSAKNRSCAAA